MQSKILKVFGYIMLAIGIIGGLSTINFISNATSAIWLILVVCFCVIGVNSLSSSKQMRNAKSETVIAENSEKRPASSKFSKKALIKTIKIYGKRVYGFIKNIIAQTDNFYLKFILTVIAVLLLIIAVEINDKLSAIAFEIYRI